MKGQNDGKKEESLDDKKKYRNHINGIVFLKHNLFNIFHTWLVSFKFFKPAMQT